MLYRITVLLALNNLLTTKYIPWFGYGYGQIYVTSYSPHHFHRRPFHAAMGVMTTRMLMHLKKAASKAQFYDELPFSQCNMDSVLIDLAFAKLAASENSVESEMETDLESPPRSLDLERGISNASL